MAPFNSTHSKTARKLAAIPADPSPYCIPFDDVLQELCLPGGDAEAGQIAIDRVGSDKLYSVLSVLAGILKKTEMEFHAVVAAGRTQSAEVAHV